MARVKIPLRTSGPEASSSPDEFSFLSAEERAEALEAQQRRDFEIQLAHKSIQLAQELAKKELTAAQQEKDKEITLTQQSVQLAQSLASKEIAKEKLKINPIVAQEKILHALNKGHQRPEDEELDWCSKRLKHRVNSETITHVTIKGRQSKRGGPKIRVTMFRGLRCEEEQPQFLKFYGYSEWLEIRDAIQNSKSQFKEVVERFLDQLLQRISKYVDIPPRPEKTPKKKKRSDADEDPILKSEHETKFDFESLFAHLVLPDLSMLNTTLPEARFYEDGEIVQGSEAGMTFMDNDGRIRLLRNAEVDKAPSKLLKIMYYNCWSTHPVMAIQKQFYERELRRRKENISD